MNNGKKPYDKKLSDWNKKLENLYVRVNNLSEVNFLVVILHWLNTTENFDDFYEELDLIEAQVRASIDAFSQRSSEEPEYEYYLAEMSSAILRVNNLRVDLSRKDPEKFLEIFRSTK